MPTNATLAALVGAVAPIVAAAVVLFKLDLTQDQQAELVAGLAAIITAAAAVYASVVHHTNAKVKVAEVAAATDKLYAPKAEPRRASRAKAS